MTVLFESATLALFLLYLRLRGWKPDDLRIGFGVRTSLQGLALLFVSHLAAAFSVIGLIALIHYFQPGHRTFLSLLLALSPHLLRHSVHVGWFVIVLATIVTAFTEEITCMAYIFNQIAARRGPAAAVVATVFLRVACHTYQDPIHLTGIALLFTIYGLVYLLTRKLWPLILAHLLLDFVSFSFLKIFHG